MEVIHVPLTKTSMDLLRVTTTIPLSNPRTSHQLQFGEVNRALLKLFSREELGHKGTVSDFS